MNDYGPQATREASQAWHSLGLMLLILCALAFAFGAAVMVWDWLHASYLVVREAKRVVLSEPPSGVRLLGPRPFDIEKEQG